MRLVAACRILLLSLLLSCPAAKAQPPMMAADINETVVQIPLLAGGKASGNHIVATLFKPNGDGPFPFVILSHGRATTAVERARTERWRYTEQSRWLVRRGLVVIVPTRRGYGATGGADVEASYACSNPWYKESLAAALDSALSTIYYAKALPFVDSKRFIAIGQSYGGFLSVGIAAANVEGLLAGINFAGGHGGDPATHPGVPCAPEKLAAVFADAGRTARVPMLWIYTENDLFFNAEVSRALHSAFTGAGGNAQYRLLPPFGNDGHLLFAQGGRIWQPVVDEFLKGLGL
jgi:dienelactone hydrolase